MGMGGFPPQPQMGGYGAPPQPGFGVPPPGQWGAPPPQRPPTGSSNPFA